jgi:MuDR family transposase.
MAEPQHPLDVGRTFDSLAELKQTCATLAIRDSFEFKTIRASVGRYEVLCKSVTCQWRVYARSVRGSSLYRIRSAHLEHECFGINHRSHQNMSSSFIADTIREKLIGQPEYRPADIVKDMQTEFGVEVDYFKAWRAKEDALLQINGTHESAYSLLPKYCADLEQANPGSIISLERTEENKFKRVFMSFGASVDGFTHCRPLLGLDGTHLKSKYQG